jgi:hypothetical protein
MNLFNRIVVILGLLLSMVCSALLFMATGPVIRSLTPFLQYLEQGSDLMSGSTGAFRLVAGFVFTLLIWVVCAALLWLEIRRPNPATVRLRDASQGEAEITVDSVVNRLEHTILQIPEITRVKPAVRDSRKGVNIVLRLETEPDIDVPAKTEQVQQLTRNTVEDQMGLMLGGIRIQMRHRAYPKSRGKKSVSEPSIDTPADLGEWKAQSMLASRQETVASSEPGTLVPDVELPEIPEDAADASNDLLETTEENGVATDLEQDA